MKSFIHRTALSNAVTLAIAALSGRGGDVLDPAAPAGAARKLILFDALAMTLAIVELNTRVAEQSAAPVSAAVG